MLIPLYLAVSLFVIGKNSNDMETENGQYAGKDAMTICVNKFIACSTSELHHASEHRHVDILCRLFPGVMKCMDAALTKHCHTSRHRQQVKMLYQELERMETKYASSKCSTENHGVKTVPSITVAWVLLTTALSLC